MNEKIDKLLKGKMKNHIMPFLWIHGESEETYRRMVKAIYEANIRAFCVEARPHKEFCKEQWWKDMDIILDEAKKRGMKIWILDDKHFPTGYANGGVEKAPIEQRRQNICHRQVRVTGGKKIRLKLNRYIHPKNNYDLMSYIMLLYGNEMRLPKKYGKDVMLSCTAYGKHGYVDLSEHIQKGILEWGAAEGEWTIEILSLSNNTGMHRSYINMMDRKSCRIQIDEVYEPHYAHYKDKFGTVIAGFFSDEPELGNYNYCKHYNYLGIEQDLPFSRELAKMLKEKLGADWKSQLPLLWNNDYDREAAACVRYIYMDCVTRLVEQDFSLQIGQWCRERGVEYIGHVIEDNNQHARTSTSLGHFFRGLKHQTMAGIDDIGGQVYPGGEDSLTKNIMGYQNDGEFYHYALGRLGASLGALNPNMKGRTMCEIFGNYGWSEGVRLEKYLVDHFMVRGINYFVPHAFSSKAYPDKDCPPHFYAHGNNPQYRHFGELMNYTNRICNLISGGQEVVQAAILYHGEAEWTGKCMLMQKPARILADNQIGFHFVPSDVFSEQEFYKTEIGKELTVNSRRHQLLIVPYSQFITREAVEGMIRLQEAGCPVVFIDGLPEGICTGEELPKEIAACKVVSLDNLLDYLKQQKLGNIIIQPADNRIRCMHYQGEEEIFYLFNEGKGTYSGTLQLPVHGQLYGYDAWNNSLFRLESADGKVKVEIEPSKSMIILKGAREEKKLAAPASGKGRRHALKKFRQSVCRSIDYPKFTSHRDIEKLESYHLTDKKFSGFIRYETRIMLEKFRKVLIEITDAYEGVEVFVNGQSAGIQVVPSFLFDITGLCQTGKNEIAIEVATTLERERGNTKKGAATGITGEVNLILD